MTPTEIAATFPPKFRTSRTKGARERLAMDLARAIELVTEEIETLTSRLNEPPVPTVISNHTLEDWLPIMSDAGGGP